MKQPTPGGLTTEERLAALRALEALLRAAASSPAEDVLFAAGELLRRADAVGVDLALVDSALREVPGSAVARTGELAMPPRLEADLVRAADEAMEAGLSDSPEEREMFSASAMEALGRRDRAESYAVALERWAEISTPHPERSGAAAESKGQSHQSNLRARLSEVDRKTISKSRALTPLNPRRRIERDLLGGAHRTAAWWYTNRVDCGQILGMLSGDIEAEGAHLEGCADCRRDLERSRPIDVHRTRHLTDEDAWHLELGDLSSAARAGLLRHAADCLQCSQVVWAMREGDAAIAELEAEERERGAPSFPPAAREPGGARPTRSHREVARREAFRVVLIRGERVRLLVQPTKGALAMAVIALPPRGEVQKPSQTRDGLEFDLGEPSALLGRTARLTVRAAQGGDNEVLEVEL